MAKHPSEWPFSGYNEIQQPKRKNVLINYNRLRELLGFETYEQVQSTHRKWVDCLLSSADNARDDKWTDSVAVGSERFTRDTKALMGSMALGRKSLESGQSFQLREPQVPYSALLEVHKDEIAPKNSYFWRRNI